MDEFFLTTPATTSAHRGLRDGRISRSIPKRRFFNFTMHGGMVTVCTMETLRDGRCIMTVLMISLPFEYLPPPLHSLHKSESHLWASKILALLYWPLPYCCAKMPRWRQLIKEKVHLGLQSQYSRVHHDRDSKTRGSRHGCRSRKWCALIMNHQHERSRLEMGEPCSSQTCPSGVCLSASPQVLDLPKQCH